MAGKGKVSSKIECLLVCQTLHSCPPAQVQQSPHQVVLDELAGGFCPVCLSHKHILTSALEAVPRGDSRISFQGNKSRGNDL